MASTSMPRGASSGGALPRARAAGLHRLGTQAQLGRRANAARGVGLPFAARFRVGVEAEHVRVLHADEFGRNGSASAIGPLLAARVGGGFEVVARGQYLWGRFDPIFGLPAYDLEGHALGIGVRWDGE